MDKLQTRWPLFFAFAMLLGMWMGYRLSRNIPDGQGFFGRPRKTSVQEVIDLLNKKYVDSVQSDSLAEVAIQQMLVSLDPHTIYIPADETAAANETLEGNFQGVGIEYTILEDTVQALQILPGGPSEKAGLQIGDRIIQVDQTPIAGKGLQQEDIRKLLRGPAGSSVTVKILRAGKQITSTIQRGVILRNAVDAAYMIDAQTGFIHLEAFSKTAYEEFMTALEALKKKGMTKLIFDLRGNGGGLMDEAVDIADEFLDSTRLIVYTEGLHMPRQEYVCKRPGEFEKGKLTILIDEFSASASEVMAGALQDWDRATIIGRRSFGKGLVQEAFELSNGAQLRMTVSKYYTPLGRNIQKDYHLGREVYEQEIIERMHNGVNHTDSSYERGKAYKTFMKGRTVFGGGGIRPDVYVPLDSSNRSESFKAWFRDQRLTQFIYQYYVAHAAALRACKDVKTLQAQFTIDPSFWDAMQQFALKYKMPSAAISAHEKFLLEQKIRSYMAMQRFRTAGFFEVENGYDPTVLQAISSVR